MLASKPVIQYVALLNRSCCVFLLYLMSCAGFYLLHCLYLSYLLVCFLLHDLACVQCVCDFLKNARAAKSDRKFEQDFSYIYVFE